MSEFTKKMKSFIWNNKKIFIIMGLIIYFFIFPLRLPLTNTIYKYPRIQIPTIKSRVEKGLKEKYNMEFEVYKAEYLHINKLYEVSLKSKEDSNFEITVVSDKRGNFRTDLTDTFLSYETEKYMRKHVIDKIYGDYLYRIDAGFGISRDEDFFRIEKEYVEDKMTRKKFDFLEFVKNENKNIRMGMQLVVLKPVNEATLETERKNIYKIVEAIREIGISDCNISIIFTDLDKEEKIIDELKNGYGGSAEPNHLNETYRCGLYFGDKFKEILGKEGWNGYIEDYKLENVKERLKRY